MGPLLILVPLAIAVFGVVGKFAMDRYNERKFREMFGSLFWAILPIALAALFWATIETSPDMARNIVLGILGGLVGACALIWLGYVVSAWNNKIMPPKSDDPGPAPTITQTGSNNIAQIGNNNQATIVTREKLELDATQERAITDGLRSFSGRKIKIFLNRETTETLAFGEALARAFKAAQIRVVEVAHMQVMGAMPPGIVFYLTKTDPSDLAFAEALAASLESVGIVKGKVPAEYANNDVFILYITPLN